MTDRPYILGFGGANMDLHVRSSAPARLRDSNPGTIHTSPGGVMRNILENAARLGVPSVLLSAVGEDAFGDRILKQSGEAGIDMSRVYVNPNCATSCYMAFMDSDGDMLIAANDMRSMELLPENYLESNAWAIAGAKVVLCDANPPQAQIERLLALAGDCGVPVFCDPVSVAKAGKFLPNLDKIALLKPNAMELEYLSGIVCGSDAGIEAAAAELLKKGLQAICVSLGSRGAYYADRAGRKFFRKLRPVEQMANATGAGDAFTAGLACAFAEGRSAEEMLDFALGCGALAVQSEDTIHPGMTRPAVLAEIEARRE